MHVTRTLSDEAAGTVDTSRVELDELEILQREASTRDHGVTVTCASVRTRAAEVCTTVSAGSEHGLVGAEPVERAVLHVQGHDADALAVFHDQVKREVLDEEICVVPEGLAVERVEEGVAGTVGSSCATVCLAALAVLERLATKSALVDLAFLRS